MRFKEFSEDLDAVMRQMIGSGNLSGLDLFATKNRAPTSTDNAKEQPKPETPKSLSTDTDSSKPAISTVDKNSPGVSNGYAPKGATEAQMRQYGPSSKNKIDWREMRSYIASKLSFNHAVGMVVNAKWESGWQPGRWVHSDASQGPSGGLFMFHDATFSGKGFFSDMVRACGGPGRWQTNWRGQIDFALSYGGSKGPAYAAKKFSSPEEATHWFCLYFERPRDAETKAKQRAKEAKLYSN